MKITDLVPRPTQVHDAPSQTASADATRMLQQEVERAFDRFWQMVTLPISPFGRLEHPDFVRVDVVDTGNAIMVTAELPGMSDADVDVSVRDGQLAIRGERKDDHEAEDRAILAKERHFGVVERTVPLPPDADADSATASFANGVLTILIPKSASVQAKAKHIPVQAG